VLLAGKWVPATGCDGADESHRGLHIPLSEEGNGGLLAGLASASRRSASRYVLMRPLLRSFRMAGVAAPVRPLPLVPVDGSPPSTG
jgi:hypothetical protein